MNDLAGLAGVDLGIAQAAITTLATMLTIGVGFLSKPSAATLYWSFAFALAMVATFGVVAGGLNDAEVLRRASLGLLLGAPALLWSGFRALWGLRAHLWAGPVLAVTAAAVLMAAGDLAAFTVAYRTAFFASSVFAGLFFLDWVRVPARRQDKVVLPMAIVSAAFFVMALGTLVAGFVFPPSGGDDFVLLRTVSSIGMVVYVGCALVAIMGVATRDTPFTRSPAATSDWQRFENTAIDRLLRAQRTSEAWSVVYLQLDDAADIRQTAGSATFGALSASLEEAARLAFPAETDIGSPAPGATVLLVPRTDAIVRDCLRDVLERVPQLDVDGRLPIRPTASAGWAPASILGYDLDALVYTAREAAGVAAEKGGDRWERVSAALVEGLLNRTERL
ncbi:UNVERIFIED_CONTAM: hypothetical protein OHV15_03295 [Microbacterium sp. SLM126]